MQTVLGQSATANVDTRHTVCFHNFVDVEVTVEHDVALAKRACVALVENVAVCEKQPFVSTGRKVVLHKSEVGNHLVNLAVAIATNCHNFVRQLYSFAVLLA